MERRANARRSSFMERSETWSAWIVDNVRMVGADNAVCDFGTLYRPNCSIPTNVQRSLSPTNAAFIPGLLHDQHGVGPTSYRINAASHGLTNAFG